MTQAALERPVSFVARAGYVAPNQPLKTTYFEYQARKFAMAEGMTIMPINSPTLKLTFILKI